MDDEKEPTIEEVRAVLDGRAHVYNMGHYARALLARLERDAADVELVRRFRLLAANLGYMTCTAVPALVAEVRRLRTQNADMLAQHTNAEHVIGETMGEARAARIDRDAAIAQVERMREAGDALAEVANGSDERSRDEEIAAWKAAR